jgi:hypothetical protein
VAALAAPDFLLLALSKNLLKSRRELSFPFLFFFSFFCFQCAVYRSRGHFVFHWLTDRLIIMRLVIK